MKKFIATITLMAFANLIFGQESELNFNLRKVASPSPMAYEMTKFGAEQPNLYTGTASTSIPLFTIDFDGWKLPLSASYSASGIRTNQEATEIGLGWSLSTTAVISRQVVGGNDLAQITDKFKGYVYEEGADLHAILDYNILDRQQRLNLFNTIKYSKFDSEPDMFNYNFFGYSGSFILTNKQNNGGLIETIKTDVNGVRITFDELNKNFSITTPDGFIGYFTIEEKTTNVYGSGSVGVNLVNNGNLVDIQTIINDGNFRVTTAWYLEKIVSPSGKEINFTYNIGQNEDSDFLSITSLAYGETKFASYLPIFENGVPIFYKGTNNSESFSRTITEHVYQESISIPNELEINFNMENREDIQENRMRGDVFPQAFYANWQTESIPLIGQPKPKRYSSISIVGGEGSSLQRSITFGQSYFNYERKFSDNPFQFLRGRLDFISLNDQTYRFEYAKGEKGLPRKSTRGIDHFGFHNGNDDNRFLLNPIHGYSLLRSSDYNDYTYGDVINANFLDALPRRFFYIQRQDRKPDINFSIAGTLSKVIYPTQGFSAYSYEAHDYYASGLSNQFTELVPEAIDAEGNSGDVTGGGIRIKEIENRDSNNQLVSKQTYSYKNTFNTSSGKLMTPMVYFINDQDNALSYQTAVTNVPFGLSLKAFHYQPSIPGSNSANNKRIGYSTVTEIFNNVKNQQTFKTTYEFENNPVGLTSSIPPKLIIEDKLNGKPISELLLDNNNHLKQINEYKTSRNNFGALPFVKYSQLVYDFEEPSQGHQGGVGYTSLHFVPFISYDKPLETINISEETTTEILENGSFEKTSKYEFNAENNIVKQESTNSKNQEIKTVSKYLSDFINGPCADASGSALCMQTELSNRNITGHKLEEITTVDDQVVRAIGYRYDLEQSNVVLKEVYAYNPSLGDYTPSPNGFDFSGSYEIRLTFDDYDEFGNVLQQTLEDGTPVSYIWDPNGNYPIVKGENISHTNLLAAYNESQGANFETALRSNTLTTNAMISTYQTDLNVGLTQVTDAKGVPTNYDYDHLNRLISVKDLNEDFISDYKYNFKEISKVGGLEYYINPFGMVSPGSSLTRNLTITNTGNYDITVYGVSLPQYFSSVWENQSFLLRPNEEFKFPVTFNAPSTTTSVNANASIQSDQLSGTTDQIILSGSVIENGIAEIQITNGNCHLLKNEFQTLQITINNTGTAPLHISSITSDDTCVKSSWEESLTVTVNDPQAGEVEVNVPRIIAAGASASFSVQLQCALDSNDNWDTEANLTINQFFVPDELLVLRPTIRLRRYESQLDCNEPPIGPAYSISSGAITQADCTNTMSGSITVHHGSIKVTNIPTAVVATNFAGATITINGGIGNIGPNENKTLNPGAGNYPKTYTFTSGTALCDPGFGRSDLTISVN